MYPAVNLIHGIGIVFNVAAGIHAYTHHDRHHLWLLDFGMAAFLVGCNVWYRRNMKRLAANHAAAMQELREAEERLRQQMEAEITPEAYSRATLNLQRICAITGAGYFENHEKVSPIDDRLYPGPWVRYARNGTTFTILAGHIIRQRPDGHYSSTCYYTVHGIPRPELVASALLLLKRDPLLFEKLLGHTGFYA